MKVNRRLLTYFASILVAFVIFKAVDAQQWILAGISILVYLAFAFGVDKFVIDLKEKKVEIDDSDTKN